jgi:uncharacterized repeat protein (TIGR01451 family)
VTLTAVAKRSGKFNIRVGAASAGDLIALPQATSIDIQDAQLTVTAHGPERAYVGQDVEWKLTVKNGGEVALSDTIIRANLPLEVNFLQASDGGKVVGGQVVWDLGTLNARQEKVLTLNGTCTRVATQAGLKVTATANPVGNRDGVARTAGLSKPIGPEKSAEAPLQIIGIAALQLSVKDTDDPVNVGQRTSYTVRLKNTGTAPATKIAVTAFVPVQMRALRATGPGGLAKLDDLKATFPLIETLAPGAEALFIVDVEADKPGEARFRVEAASSTTKQPIRAEEPTRILGAYRGPQ